MGDMKTRGEMVRAFSCEASVRVGGKAWAVVERDAMLAAVLELHLQPEAARRVAWRLRLEAGEVADTGVRVELERLCSFLESAAAAGWVAKSTQV